MNDPTPRDVSQEPQRPSLSSSHETRQPSTPASEQYAEAVYPTYPEVAPANLPEVAPSQDPESLGVSNPGGWHRMSEDKFAIVKDPADSAPEAVRKYAHRAKPIVWICGLRRRWFLILVAVLVVLGAVIGIAAGVTAGQRSSKPDAESLTRNSTSGVTALGAVVSDDGKTIKMFSQNAATNHLVESIFTSSSNKWQNSELSNVTFVAHTPLAAISWSDLDQIRLYYINEKGYLSEGTYSEQGQKWVTESNLDGDGKVQPANFTNLAAVRTADGISVFYQNDEDAIVEQVWDKVDKWRQGSTFGPKGIHGTGIAVARADDSVQLFYQTSNSSILEYKMTNNTEAKWIPGDVWPATVDGAPLAAVTWEGGNKTRLFSRHDSSSLWFAYRDPGDEPAPKTISAADVNNNTDLAAFAVGDGGELTLRAFYQNSSDGFMMDTYSAATLLWSTETILPES